MHIPVLLKPLLQLFRGKTIRTLVDATLGAAGLSCAIIQEHPEIETFIGIDQDSSALQIAKEKLESVLSGSQKMHLIHANFCHLSKIMSDLSVSSPDAIVMDIGVSSMQLDKAERGFSFLRDGPLDMRMDQTLHTTAEDIIHTFSQKELADIFYHFGEERRSRQAAQAIVQARKKLRLDTTAKLVNVLDGVLFRTGKAHPATKIFQALRIAVNRELDVLQAALPQAENVLALDGILAVISFHSLEDRIVKEQFRQIQKEGNFHVLTKKPIAASYDECYQNTRARSAKLRAIQKC